MRQLLINSRGALVARTPRPTPRPGQVLVRVHASLVSTGTETAPLRALGGAEHAGKPLEQAGAYASLARRYLGKAIRDPRKAAQRAAGIVRREFWRLQSKLAPAPASTVTAAEPVVLGELAWERGSARKFEIQSGRLELETDTSECGYQIVSSPIPLSPDQWPAIEIKGQVHEGMIAFGLLDESREQWLGQHRYGTGTVDDRLVFDPRGSASVTLVVTTAGEPRPSRLTLDSIQVQLVPGTEGGVTSNELADQGWAVGYSAAGTIVELGAGVSDLSVGDRVACAGAGVANHADYIAAPRHLVCPVPAAVDFDAAATTTVGSIALQGVRRAEPRLGETVCVLGLGLIGQLTVQLLKASGCRVIGLDLVADRVERARSLGLDAGTHDSDQLAAIVRDFTGGHGVDSTLITASSKSNAVINQAMAVTRRRGTVVIVGDVGLGAERGDFYRKEIDLRMSTSYGPGRYDARYEHEGEDYPYAYVRWTLNRNMEAYLDLIARGEVDAAAIIDRTTSIDEAPAVYEELASGDNAPLGVVIQYPATAADESRPQRVRIRGHRKPVEGRIHYALVGAGGFAQGMLVPQLDRLREKFFLRGVVSRDASRGGNFARDHRVEVFASDIDDVLTDPEFDLMVIATRHDEHADQVIRSLRAGKHVFVEKPLAITWDGLHEIESAWNELPEPPTLMVGFNRRFSPALQKLAEITATRRTPLVIHYRLNGGYIPTEHWVQTEQGGGRNLGEACHMYDVFRFLAGAPVRSVTATAIDPGVLPYLRNDNFAATLGYEDGSVGNLVYTALGPKTGLPKERIEVFVDGEAYIVDDFTRLTRASDDTVLWQDSKQDKGHAEELRQLGEALAAGHEAPIPFDEMVETSAVALRIEDLLHGRDRAGDDGADTVEA